AEVQVIAIRKESAVALLRGSGQRSRSTPGLNGDVLRQGRIENFVPANHAFAVLLDDWLEMPVEIRLQRLIVFEAVGALELLNLLVGVPLLAVHFVAAHVKKLVGKEPRHLADKLVEKLVSALFRGVHGGIEDAPAPLDFVRTRAACQFRMSDKPRSAVAGNIKFRDYADAAIPRISNHVADFFLRVIPPVGAQLLQLGKSLAFDAEALIVREVPVKNIHLHGI